MAIAFGPNGVVSSAVRNDEGEGDKKLSKRESSKYRAAAARANRHGANRPDLESPFRCEGSVPGDGGAERVGQEDRPLHPGRPERCDHVGGVKPEVEHVISAHRA